MIRKILKWFVGSGDTKRVADIATTVDVDQMLQATREFKDELLEIVEKFRLASLYDLGLLRKDLNDDLKEYVIIAAKVCDTKHAAIDLIAETQVWIKAKVGGEDYPEVCERADSFCHFTIRQNGLTVIPDAALDYRVQMRSAVLSNTIRFYAGAPLLTSDGHALGAICVWDDQPRDLSPLQREILHALGRAVATLLMKIKPDDAPSSDRADQHTKGGQGEFRNPDDVG